MFEGESLQKQKNTEKKTPVAAVAFNGEVFVGTHHGEAYDKLVAKYPSVENEKNPHVVDGFLTPEGAFVDMKTALRLGKEQGQIHKDETIETFGSGSFKKKEA